MIAFRLPTRLTDAVFYFLIMHVAARRPPDLIVGQDNPGGPYLRRWWLTPWRGWYANVPPECRTRWERAVVWTTKWLPNLYLHHFLRDDDDRAHHDHPSWAWSWLLRNGYIEHTIAAGGIHQRKYYWAGSVRYLPTRHTHRIELLKTVPPGYSIEYLEPEDQADLPIVSEPCWTLFLFGPKTRDWGFHCPQKGWVPWREFTAPGKPGEVGRGCE